MSSIEEFVKDKGITLKPKKVRVKDGNKLSNAQIIALCRVMLKDLGYIE